MLLHWEGVGRGEEGVDMLTTDSPQVALNTKTSATNGS